MSTNPDIDTLLAEQIAYYRARAPEYDDWWHRRGYHDRGAEANAQWHAEVAQLEQALEKLEPRGNVLEIACGTGLWTRHLVRYADHITAVDSAPETIAVNRQRLNEIPGPATVEYVTADVFGWRPTHQYDVVFIGFWLSHVPSARFREFWHLMRDALAPAGRVILIDNYIRGEPTEDWIAGPEGEAAIRHVQDGRWFRMVKIFDTPETLTARLATVGWEAQLEATPNHFMFGTVRPLDAESAPAVEER